MDRLTKNLINFNKLVIKNVRFVLTGTALAVFVDWALFKLGVIASWKDPKTALFIWILTLIAANKLSRAYEYKKPELKEPLEKNNK